MWPDLRLKYMLSLADSFTAKQENLKTAGAMMREEFDDPYTKAVACIFQAHSHLLSTQNEHFKACGISADQYRVLKILSGEQQTVSVSSIQERMINKMSNASRLVEKLMKSGLAHRMQSQGDRRQALVSITARGRETLISLEEEIRRLPTTAIRLSGEELEELNHLLGRLLDFMAVKAKQPES